MPLFEFGAARQLEGDAAEPPADSGRIAQVIEDNLDGLVGEQVFPVVRADSPDEPYLIALDPSGAPVVVEVVKTLDNAMLIRSLDHAGAAGRMTRGQLAGHYPGGTQAFLHHLAAFMDSVPVKRARLPRSGSRLIIICEDSADEVLNAVDFLRQPAMPVEVIRMDLVNGLGGRRFLDLSPLVISPDSAPDHPRLFGSAPKLEPPARAAAKPTRKSDLAAALAAAHQAVARAETVLGGEVSEPAPSSAPTPSAAPKMETRRQRRERLAAERAAEVAVRRAAAARRASVPQSEPTLVISGLPDSLGSSDIGGVHAEHLATGLQSGEPIPYDWQPQTMPAGLTIDGVLAAGTEINDPLSWDTAQLPVVVQPMATGPTVRRTPIAEAAAASRPIPTVSMDLPTEAIPLARLGPTTGTELGRPGRHSMPGRVAAEGGMTPIDDRTDAKLVALAGRFGEPTELVWERPRRRQRFTATLDPVGLIHVSGIGDFHNPDAAARAVSGSQFADGWTVWRVYNADGMTLREAFTIGGAA